MDLKKKLFIIAGVYVIEGFPMGIFRDLWPVYFRVHEVSLATIGAVSGLYLVWSLKFFWSPLIDRFGERRQWISATQDIAIDAYTIGIVERGEEGPANSARIIAYRVGLIASGGGLLLLPNHIGWPATYAVAATLMVLMATGVFACPRGDKNCKY